MARAPESPTVGLLHSYPFAGVTPPPFDASGGNLNLNPFLGLGPVPEFVPAVPASHGFSGERDDGRQTCVCGKHYATMYTLKRHIKTADAKELKALLSGPLLGLTPGPSSTGFPCNFCEKYQGPNAFPRRDYLRQHLSVFHKHDKAQIDDYIRACFPA